LLHAPLPHTGGHTVISERVGVGTGVVVGGSGDVVGSGLIESEIDGIERERDAVRMFDTVRVSVADGESSVTERPGDGDSDHETVADVESGSVTLTVRDSTGLSEPVCEMESDGVIFVYVKLNVSDPETDSLSADEKDHVAERGNETECDAVLFERDTVTTPDFVGPADCDGFVAVEAVSVACVRCALPESERVSWIESDSEAERAALRDGVGVVVFGMVRESVMVIVGSEVAPDRDRESESDCETDAVPSIDSVREGRVRVNVFCFERERVSVPVSIAVPDSVRESCAVSEKLAERCGVGVDVFGSEMVRVAVSVSCAVPDSVAERRDRDSLTVSESCTESLGVKVRSAVLVVVLVRVLLPTAATGRPARYRAATATRQNARSAKRRCCCCGIATGLPLVFFWVLSV
jgi:hypothetical protein